MRVAREMGYRIWEGLRAESKVEKSRVEGGADGAGDGRWDEGRRAEPRGEGSTVEGKYEDGSQAVTCAVDY